MRKAEINNEQKWDALLHIQTAGRDESRADAYRYPYEPTPYCVLERLANSGLIGKHDTVLDYGCGKGRVSHFLSTQIGARVIGIEYDELIYREAVQNGENDSCRFELIRAEEYDVGDTVNRCYFFNPFSVEILQSVMAKILASYYADPREMLLFFYYPSDEYMCYLMSISELDFYDEIDCDDLFEHPDARERIMVFSLPAY